MPTMNISLPENLKEFVESQVQSGEYSSVSEFMRELLRRELKALKREHLELQLLEGLDSGEGVEATPEIWKRLREQIRGLRRKTKPAE
ncbi:MAG: type II toxin-antitoxin system ParD family antitoxin [Terracidiphilus sp.]